MSDTRALRRASTIGLVLLAGACTNVSLPVIGTDPGNAPPPRTQTTQPPAPDARGVISYPTYQAVYARRGDTVGSVAARLGIDPVALGRRNGLPVDAALREGELLLLPVRVPDETAAPAGGDDLASLAASALDRADGIEPASTAAAGTVQAGPEPVRHVVARGETAYSIARLYNVNVRALADWNGLPADYTVREGQTLLIPLADGATPAPVATVAVAETSVPGEGTVAPEPPSAAEPQPAEAPPAPATAEPVAVAPIEAPQTTASDTATLAKPVEGRILRPYAKGTNDGVDFAATVGAPVRAATGGTIAAITRDVDQVPIVVIRHPDNLLTVYANVDAISVAKGDTVSRGQQIGVVRQSNPGFLHFEVRNGFESVDPVDYLN